MVDPFELPKDEMDEIVPFVEGEVLHQDTYEPFRTKDEKPDIPDPEDSIENRSIITALDLMPENVERLFRLTSYLKTQYENNNLDSRVLAGKVVACVFYEASTRTSSSFIAAVNKLGGSTIPINGVQYSSIAKGEDLHDTIRTLAQYADVIVIRGSYDGAARDAQLASALDGVPIINAGDGPGEHPTQAFTDLFTIKEHLGNLHGKSIALVGDLKHSRTIHSLLKLLGREAININLCAPKSMQLPLSPIEQGWRDDRARYFDYNEASFKWPLSIKYVNFDEAVETSDIVYMTRSQTERMSALQKLLAGSHGYIFTYEHLARLRKTAGIMHPMPRLEEVEKSVDYDERAIYFKQVKNGMFIRMALLISILGLEYKL